MSVVDDRHRKGAATTKDEELELGDVQIRITRRLTGAVEIDYAEKGDEQNEPKEHPVHIISKPVREYTRHNGNYRG
jgi:hypothetical protein